MMKHQIYISNSQKKIKGIRGIKSLITKAVNETLDHEDISFRCEISVMLVDNEQMKEINNSTRNIAAPTDVLSFPILEFDGSEGDLNLDTHSVLLGDIVISLEKAAEQAEEYNHSFDREISFLTIHGMLHLLSYDHEKSKKEEKLMFNKQTEIIEKLKLKG